MVLILYKLIIGEWMKSLMDKFIKEKFGLSVLVVWLSQVQKVQVNMQ